VILAAVLLLAACVGGDRGATVFRSPEQPIWSAAAFQPAQIAGGWRQVADFAARPGGCAAGGLDFAPVAGGLAVRGSLCLDGQERRVDGIARPAGPGRLAIDGQEDWWILWVDSGYRTLAVGTPSGRFGFVLDRAALPPDRLAAAREVFDFNGYNPAALRPL
jgi:apolipoprotein D and lipocalin family protein